MNELNIIENELIPVYETSTGEKVVYGSDLHNALGSPSVYREWVSRRFKDCDAVQNEDYEAVEISTPSGQTKKDHIIKLDIAKEMAMLERNEKGKQVRRYFIEVEKKYKKNLPSNYVEALENLLESEKEKMKLIESNQVLTKEISMKEQIIGEMKPKADYTDIILKSKSTVTITQIAKDYGMSGTEMNKILHNLHIQYKQSGQWLLYEKYQKHGYTHSETVKFTRKNGIEDVTMNTKWTQKGRLFLYDKLKENGYLPMIEQKIA